MFDPDDKDDPWAIPAFLRRPKDWRPEPLHGRRLRWTKDMKFAPPPSREEEAATRKLRREIEAMAKAKREAKFAELRARPRKKKRPATVARSARRR